MSSSKRSSSASTAINEDLLIEILLFLPAKSVVKFKIVSKRWNSLISSPFFCRRHTLHRHRHRHRHLETQHAFVFHSVGSRFHVYNPTVPRFFAIEFNLKFFSKVEILQSCNGLLLLRCRWGRYHYFVCNPTTLQKRDLSPLPSTSVAGIYLIFDPSTSPYYTVVCFEKTKTFTRVHSYDSQTRKWKLGGERIARNTIFHDGISLNGVIFFLRCSSSSSYRFTPDDGLTKIPALPRLRFRIRRTSHTVSFGTKRDFAMESNGVVLLFLWHETNVLVVYEMKKEMECGWSKKYEVDMNPISDEGFNMNNVDLHFVNVGDKEEDSMLLFNVLGKLMIYRFHGAKFEVLADFNTFHRDKEGPSSFGNARHFIQSLAPV